MQYAVITSNAVPGVLVSWGLKLDQQVRRYQTQVEVGGRSLTSRTRSNPVILSSFREAAGGVDDSDVALVLELALVQLDDHGEGAAGPGLYEDMPALWPHRQTGQLSSRPLFDSRHGQLWPDQRVGLAIGSSVSVSAWRWAFFHWPSSRR
jgi:hypothetical protein